MEDLEDKYGVGNTYERYDSPYEKGDGYTTTAISVGKAHFNTYWTKLIGGTIQLSINYNHTVELTYQDDEIIEDAISDQKSRRSEDF